MEKIVSYLYLVMVIVNNSVFLVEGIRCFACDSSADGDVCDSSVELTSSNTSFIVENCEYCSRYYFANDNVIIRSCVKKTSGLRLVTGCDSCKLSGSTVRSCYCDHDLCNSAISWKKGIPVSLILVFVYYWNVMSR